MQGVESVLSPKVSVAGLPTPCMLSSQRSLEISSPRLGHVCRRRRKPRSLHHTHPVILLKRAGKEEIPPRATHNLHRVRHMQQTWKRAYDALLSCFFFPCTLSRVFSFPARSGRPTLSCTLGSLEDERKSPGAARSRHLQAFPPPTFPLPPRLPG